MADPSFEQIAVGGRRLDVLSSGPVAGPGLVLHSGTPSAAVAFRPMVEAATSRGLRFVTYSRPGYAGSDPHPGRAVADAAADVAGILDHLEIGPFVTAGWSGGGPHALACAAGLPGRCLAAATIAGVAPFTAEGLDWLSGMGAENRAEFGAAREGAAELTTWLETAAAELAAITGAEVATALGDLITDVDRSALTGGFADWSADSFRASVSTGVAGWRDDDLAFVAPWGFDLAAVGGPVAVWQGDQDRMVPFDHGRWLAAHVSGAQARLRPGQGHLSILVDSFDEILDDLIRLVG